MSKKILSLAHITVGDPYQFYWIRNAQEMRKKITSIEKGDTLKIKGIGTLEVIYSKSRYSTTEHFIHECFDINCNLIASDFKEDVWAKL